MAGILDQVIPIMQPQYIDILIDVVNQHKLTNNEQLFIYSSHRASNS